jgi:hypothetical protein
MKSGTRTRQPRALFHLKLKDLLLADFLLGNLIIFCDFRTIRTGFILTHWTLLILNPTAAKGKPYLIEMKEPIEI